MELNPGCTWESENLYKKKKSIFFCKKRYIYKMLLLHPPLQWLWFNYSQEVPRHSLFFFFFFNSSVSPICKKDWESLLNNKALSKGDSTSRHLSPGWTHLLQVRVEEKIHFHTALCFAFGQRVIVECQSGRIWNHTATESLCPFLKMASDCLINLRWDSLA